MNKNEIAKNKVYIEDHSQELEKGKKEREGMQEAIKKLQGEMETRRGVGQEVLWWLLV